MNQGRIKVIKKMFSGFKEEENCLDALESLARLNEALKYDEKVLRYVQLNGKL